MAGVIWHHIFRVYLLAQKWSGVDSDPTEWSWRKGKNGYMSVENEKVRNRKSYYEVYFVAIRLGALPFVVAGKLVSNRVPAKMKH